MVGKGRITQQQSDKLLEIFERGYNNNEQKRINRLEKGLKDEENINRIVASSNLKFKKQFKRQGNEYEQELIKKKREELGQLYKEDIEHTNIDKEDIDKNLNENMNYFNFQSYDNIFNNNIDVTDFIKDNINILKIDNDDKYLFKSILSNLFRTTEKSVVIDATNYDSSLQQIAFKQILYLIKKYIGEIFNKLDIVTDEVSGEFVETRGNMNEIEGKGQLFNSLKAYIFDSFMKYYKTINDEDILKYLNYVNNILDLVGGGDEYTLTSESDVEDLKLMPEIVKLNSIISKFDIKRISTNNIVELAEQWNKIFNSKQSLKKIWTYLGLSKRDVGGASRGSLLWDKLFERNPFYSKKHKLFAIEGIKEIVDRKNRIANYDKIQSNFIKNNKELFKDKGETLTTMEAIKMFKNIIEALEKGEKSTLQEQQSLSSKEKYKKGSGISKKEILKHLKSNSTKSKPNTKDLDTSIFKILNS